MGRNRGRREEQQGGWEGERTMAAAEEDARLESSDTRCACGSDKFILQAFLEVKDGTLLPDPVEVEALTCPECGREYEAVAAEGGRVLRGDFLGYFDEGDEA